MYSVSFSINVSICTIDLNIFIAIIFVLVYTTKNFFLKHIFLQQIVITVSTFHTHTVSTQFIFVHMVSQHN